MKPAIPAFWMVLSWAVFGLLSFHAHAQEAVEPGVGVGESRSLRVATKVAEPFVIEAGGAGGAGGSLAGISIELWERLAGTLGYEYEYEVVSLDELIEGVEAGEYDVGIGALSVTPEREERLDLSHGYYTSGLGIATGTSSAGGGWLRGFLNLFTVAFASAVGALALLLLVVGALVWLVERRHNPEQFGGGTLKGIGSGFWFSAVTMTTVGYGDKAPRTLAGRLVSLVWMFGSIIIISAFTGAIASSLTTARIDTGVRGPEDLQRVSVGALADSATVGALRQRGVTARGYGSVEEGLEAVASGRIEAFVHDRPILQHAALGEFAGQVRVLDAQFNLTSYALAVPQGSELLEPLNQALLAATRERWWEDVLNRWLGE